MTYMILMADGEELRVETGENYSSDGPIGFVSFFDTANREVLILNSALIRSIKVKYED